MSDHANEFSAFMASMPLRLSTFIESDLPESVSLDNDETREFRKDLSPASLPWIEAFATSALASPAVAVAPENQKFTENLMRYVGEVFLRGLGGAWDYDESGEVGEGFPFIRPDSPDGDCEGEPISMIGLVMTALQARNGQVFVSRYAQELEKFGEDGPRRSCSAVDDTADGGAGAPMEDEEREFLGTFLPTVESGVAAWVQDQAAPNEWSYDGDGLLKLSKQLVARYSTVNEMLADRSDFYIQGALRFAGETFRRTGKGTWRYGTRFDTDDPRQKQPYVHFSQIEVDVVPWAILTSAFKDTQAPAEALDALRSQVGGEGAGA